MASNGTSWSGRFFRIGGSRIASATLTFMWDLTLRVARFLELPVEAIRDPQVDLRPRVNPDAPLRRVRDLPPERLSPAIFAALKIAEAVVRNLRDPTLPVRACPGTPAVGAINWPMRGALRSTLS